MSDIRRSPFLVSYWEDGRLQVHNYATGARYAVCPQAVEILDRLEHWTGVEELLRELPDRAADAVRAKLDKLLEHGLVESMAGTQDPAEIAMARWGDWNPVAGLFHQATRDVSYTPPRAVPRRWPLLTRRNYPSPLKSYPRAERLELPDFPRDGELAAALIERRSWRRFGRRPVTLEEVATLLGLTWAVQRWMHLDDSKRVALKTSPSGGARHSLEVYLLAFDIDGLPAGTYHYGPDRHTLALLEPATSRACLREFMPTQPWFHRPAAVFFMTSVFERVQWKYSYARAYRVVLLEAGHFCQTFCLVGTSLGLAPFCTAAIGDTAVERHLGVDGIGESVLYAAGVGSRPEGEEWAPAPEGEEVPVTSAPTYRRRAHRHSSGA